MIVHDGLLLDPALLEHGVPELWKRTSLPCRYTLPGHPIDYSAAMSNEDFNDIISSGYMAAEGGIL